MVKLFSHLYTFLLVLSILLQPLPATRSYNVLRYEVKGNGVTDSIQAFINAWAAACGSTGSTSIYVPNGRYLLGSLAFKGDCKSSYITILLEITVYWLKLTFGSALKGLQVFGSTVVHSMLRDRRCGLVRLDAYIDCPIAAPTWSFTNSKNIKITGSSVIKQRDVPHCDQCYHLIYFTFISLSSAKMAIKFFGTHLYLFLLILSSYSYQSSAATNYNVLIFGAKGNGVTDSNQAFSKAWAAACGSTEPATIYVPKGRYLLGSMAFKGDCKNSDITIRIDGTLVAPSDYHVLGQSDNWLSFERVSGVSIIGGALDAKGTALWNCKAKGTNCPNGATTLSFTNSNNIKINGFLSLNSQMFHIVINGCQNVHVERIKVIAAGDSPNTDGVHVQLSQNVNIMSSSIKTGDDCISIGPGTKNLWIEHVTCGPGHGISIGSLAKDMDEERSPKCDS
ncbi:hypothetical protein Pint_24959 [Pistacia integerrima]|uniref:Uncharacterized protein n=1 Tax=Pistacia integerrima TaxID=434235 RepID=A0ACC0YH73_9ROSI|nr:hypothetical protein Pint_24959 [Pistacia integerrima]